MWYSIPSLVWFEQLLDPKKKNLKFANTRHSRISQNSVWKPYLFPRQAIPKTLFALHFHYTGDTPYGVWFDFDNSLTRWQRTIFEIRKIRNSWHSQNSVWNPIFFQDKLCQKSFLLYTFSTLVILLADFGLIWTTPWHDENELFLEFAKIRF